MKRIRKNKQNRQLKIIIILLGVLTIAISSAIAIYFLLYHEDIEQIKKEVTLSYTQEANRDSSYYFKGQRKDEKFDKKLFIFEEIKDYKVKLAFKGNTYQVIFHIIDDVKPEISFLNTNIDLYQGFELNELYGISDKSKTEVSTNLTKEDFVEGENEFCVEAKDEYGNTNRACTTIVAEDSTPTPSLYTDVTLNYDYANMSIDDIIADYKSKRGLTSQIAISYYNFVTQETYFDNADQYMTAGSTYKLPLNLYYYEQEKAGLINPNTMLTYQENDFEAGGPVGDNYKVGDQLSIKDLHYYSLVYSDNTASRMLFAGLGGWGNYRSKIQKYSNISYPSAFYENKFCVRYINDVLKYLYNNSGNFPDMMYYLSTVAPGDCLKRYVSVPIYQKDGFYGVAYNAAGLVYANAPYAVSVYTSLGEAGPHIIGEVNLLLYNYANAH